MCYCSLCGLPVCSLFVFSLVKPFNPEWFSPNSSGINLKGEMDTEDKRETIKNTTRHHEVCFDKRTHRERFIVFISISCV